MYWTTLNLEKLYFRIPEGEKPLVCALLALDDKDSDTKKFILQVNSQAYLSVPLTGALTLISEYAKNRKFC